MPLFVGAAATFPRDQDPLINVYARLVHVPGAEPVLPDQAGNFLMSILSHIYDLVEGPQQEDFHMGNSRVPMSFVTKVLEEHLKQVYASNRIVLSCICL